MDIITAIFSNMSFLLGILASLGFCFAGSSLLTINLSKMVGSHFYTILMKGTKTKLRAFFAGAALNAVLSKSSALSSVLSSFVASGTMQLSNAVFVLIGGSIGSIALFYLITIKMKTLTLFLIGVSGIWFGFIREGEKKYIGRAFFGISLLLYGIFVMDLYTGPKQYEWIRGFFQTFGNQNWLISFGIGIIARLVLQTGTILIIIQMQLLESGALDLNHILFIQCGTRFASAIMLLINNSHFRAAAFKIVIVQVVLNVILVLTVFFLIAVEKYTGLPVIVGAVQAMSSTPSLQIANAALYTSVISSLLLMLGNRYLLDFLDRFGGKEVEDPATPMYIQNLTYSDSGYCMMLVLKEEARVINNNYMFLQQIRNVAENGKPIKKENQIPSTVKLSKEIEGVLKNLLVHSESKVIFNRVLNLLHLSSSIYYMEHTLRLFFNEVNISLQDPQQIFKPMLQVMIETFDVIIYAIQDCVNTPSEDNIELLFTISNDKTLFLSKLQSVMLKNIDVNDEGKKNQLIVLIGYFERFIWLSREIAVCLQKEQLEQGEADQM